MNQVPKSTLASSTGHNQTMVNKSLEADGRSSKIDKCPVCKKIADKQCSGCHNISYCCAEHQKKHWKVHKNECRIFTVKRNEVYGRFLVATRDIPQGTNIFTEEPITYGPKRCTYPVCLGCHKRVDGSYHCSKCTYPMCSEECEKSGIHAENECLIFQRGCPVGSKISNFDTICPAYECITPLRCLLLKERNVLKWERLITMEHHNELRKTVPGLWNRNYVNVVKLLLDWYKMKEELDEETIHSVLGYIDVNCFEIKYKGVEICGVYRDAGLMCHDCVPNTHNAICTSDYHKMIVRSSIPIKKGEMITTSYANQMNGTQERRWFMKNTKYFDCFCQRCQDRTEFATYISAVKCPDCATGYLLPKDPLNAESTDWICTNTSLGSKSDNSGVSNQSKMNNGNLNCTKAMKEDQVQTIIRKASKDIDEVSRSSAGSPVSRLERLLKKFSGKILHPNHYLLLSVIKNLNYSYANAQLPTLQTSNENSSNCSKEELVDLDHLHRSKSLCLQLLGVLDMIDPGLTRLRGVALYQLSLPDFQITRTKFQKKEITQAEYAENVEKILSYLQTSTEILELDKAITPKAFLYQDAVEQLESLRDVLTSLSSA